MLRLSLMILSMHKRLTLYILHSYFKCENRYETRVYDCRILFLSARSHFSYKNLGIHVNIFILLSNVI